MRFVRSGINWAGVPWKVSAALDSLCDAVEALYPTPSPYDGTVSSQVHDQVNPYSDHRPDNGIVRAVDIGELSTEGDLIAEALRAHRDHRVNYVIHAGQIFSSYGIPGRDPFAWGPYYGYNAHLDHVHVSLLKAYDDDHGVWQLTLEDEMMEEVVKDIQQSLNFAGFTDKDGASLTEDGKWGAKTHQAFRKMCKAAAAESGPKGPKGDPGPPGPAGADGVDGTDGTLIIRGRVSLP